ncbi:MAG: S66 peptidase family protein [Bdellovibrionia bacterium]
MRSIQKPRTTRALSRIGVIAPSSKVPEVELELGVERIRQEGFVVDVHPQCFESHLFFAGTDEQRAQAFFDYARSPDHAVLWCARGGHGSTRLLPQLQKLALKRGKPKAKLLVGYSDATALMEYVRSAWGWSTLHAPMPSLRKFSLLGDSDWGSMRQLISGKSLNVPWDQKPLEFLGTPPKKPVEGTLVGGNLTVWNCLLATRFQPQVEGKILFFEDVDESLYRIDRLLQQLLNSGTLKGARALVLGNFLNCEDPVPWVLKKKPPIRDRSRVLSAPEKVELKPLRRSMEAQNTLKILFQDFSERLGVPVAFGLPVGHGPEVSPLPLGAEVRLEVQGRSPKGTQRRIQGGLQLLSWDWLKTSQNWAPFF